LVASSNYATTQDLANLAHRVDALEAALIKAGSLVPADLEKCLTQIRSKVVVAPAPESAHAPAANPPMGNQMHDDDGENVSDTEGAALTLEHLAFGRSRVDGSHSLPHFRDRRISSVMKPVPGQGYHLASSGHAAGESPSQLHQNGAAIYSPGHKRPSIDIKSSTTAEERTAHMLALADTMHPGDVFDMYFKKTDIILNALTRVLPDQKRGEILVNAFLLKVDWLHRRE
jgi:hypothetical protein